MIKLPENNKRIKRIISEFNEADQEIHTWYQSTLKPLLRQCKSYEELSMLREQVAFDICGGDYADYKLPSYIRTVFAIAMSNYIEEEDE
jgi:hypothetical protein